MGEIVPLDTDSIASALTNLIANQDRRRAMRESGLTLIDGKGAQRIAAELAVVSVS
jgi:hypothetical protein